MAESLPVDRLAMGEPPDIGEMVEIETEEAELTEDWKTVSSNKKRRISGEQNGGNSKRGSEYPASTANKVLIVSSFKKENIFNNPFKTERAIAKSQLS